jgi:hypothetical protein
MRKYFYILILCVLTFSCSTEKEVIDTVIEDGVEVVLNHLEPYKVEDEPTDFHLQEELTIDLGSEEIGELGIADTMNCEIDSKGCIYFTYSHKQGDMVYKFSGNGRFLKSWGKKGQGPGEMQFIISTYMTPEDNLIVSDHSNRRILWFSDEGELINEIAYPRESNYYIIYPKGSERFVGSLRTSASPDSEYIDFIFDLLDQNFEVISKLDVYKYPNPITKGRRGINVNYFFKAKRSGDYIYVGNEDRGYEIQKFDLQGNLIKKIRKEYIPVKVPASIIKERKERFSRPDMKFYFPEHYLPICDFFLDDNNRLYVMTFEKDEISGEYWYDIFNPEGIFRRRKTLPILSGGEIFAFAKIKNDKLYCFQEKEDGYRIFKVYNMSWD